MKFIRTRILFMTLEDLAKLLNTSAPRVSRWEHDQSSPTRDEMIVIRQAAQEQGITWNDLWFFESPKQIKYGDGEEDGRGTDDRVDDRRQA